MFIPYTYSINVYTLKKQLSDLHVNKLTHLNGSIPTNLA